MKIFKCIICKKPYLGIEKPSHCPNCGVLSKYINLAKETVVEEFHIEQSVHTILQNLIEIKEKNIQFYSSAKEAIEDYEMKELFHLFEEIEISHREVFKNFGIKDSERNIDSKKNKAYDFDEDNISEALHRKNEKVDFYKDVHHKIQDATISETIAALFEVEEEHISLIEDKYI